MIISISSEIELEKIFNESASNFKLLIIEFFATWCDLSLQFSPEFEKLSIEYSANVNFVRIDCDKLQDLAIKLKIKSLPTVKGYFNKKECFSFSGIHVSKAALEIQEHIVIPPLKQLSVNSRIYLLKIIENIINYPSEKIYRRIKLENMLEENFLCGDVMKECLFLLGFLENNKRLCIEEPRSLDTFEKFRKQLLMLGATVDNTIFDEHENIAANNQVENKRKQTNVYIKREKSVKSDISLDEYELDSKCLGKLRNMNVKIPNKQISNELRRKIIGCLENNVCSRKSASEIFNVPYATVASIYRKYCKSEETDKKVRTQYKPKKLRENEITSIENWLVNDCTLTLGEIKNKIVDEFGISVSLATISRYISDFYFSIERVKNRVNTSIKEIDNDARKKYCLWLRNAIKEDREIIFIDEASYRISMRGFHKKSPCGENAMIKTKTRTVTAAMSRENLFYYQSMAEPGNHFSFTEFLTRLIDMFAEKQMKNVALIFDVYLRESVNYRNIISESGHQLIEFPPDSRYLNPIEHMYSQWSSIIRSKAPENEEQLMNNVDNFQSIVTATECNNYFNQCLNSI